MVRKYSTLAVTAPHDALLDHLAPIGLASALGTALVVDLRHDRPGYGGDLTVGDLVRDGVRRVHLGPTRRGVAVLGADGIDADAAYELVAQLGRGWPGVVVRTPDRNVPFPIVETHPIFPRAPWPDADHPAVFQRLSVWHRPEVDGVVLPPLRRSQVAAMLSGRVSHRWKWVQAWQRVWELSWD